MSHHHHHHQNHHKQHIIMHPTHSAWKKASHVQSKELKWGPWHYKCSPMVVCCSLSAAACGLLARGFPEAIRGDRSEQLIYLLPGWRTCHISRSSNIRYIFQQHDKACPKMSDRELKVCFLFHFIFHPAQHCFKSPWDSFHLIFLHCNELFHI